LQNDFTYTLILYYNRQKIARGFIKYFPELADFGDMLEPQSLFMAYLCECTERVAGNNAGLDLQILQFFMEMQKSTL